MNFYSVVLFRSSRLKEEITAAPLGLHCCNRKLVIRGWGDDVERNFEKLFRKPSQKKKKKSAILCIKDADSVQGEEEAICFNLVIHMMDIFFIEKITMFTLLS